MYVCMFVCMFVCIYVFMYTHLTVFMYLCIHTLPYCTYIHTYTPYCRSSSLAHLAANADNRVKIEAAGGIECLATAICAAILPTASCKTTHAWL